MSTPPGTWARDVLGTDWQAQTLPLAPDAGGRPVATLVRPRTEDVPASAAAGRPAVLYLHGFTDYFFQAEHAEGWVAAGYAFYALDLRDYGRSIRPGRQPGWVSDLRTYFEEINLALGAIEAAGHGAVVLLGHSTGALIGALYADAHPDRLDALVLNSPWFDLNEPWPVRHIIASLAAHAGRFLPHLPVGALAQPYGRSLHVSTGGEFDYDLVWKPFEGFPVQAGWLRAIRTGQRALSRGLDIHAPVLVCTSGRSGHPKHPTAHDLAGADCVLDVDQMHRLAPRLGPDVQIEVIDGGRHDLALSRPPARQDYLDTVLAWLERRLDGDGSG